METDNYKLIIRVHKICDKFPGIFNETKKWIDPVIAAFISLEAYRSALQSAKDELKAHRHLRSRMLATRFLDVSPHGPYGMPLDNIINRYKNVVNAAGGLANNVLVAIKATRQVLENVQRELALNATNGQLTDEGRSDVSKLAADILRHLQKTAMSANESTKTDPTSSSYWPSSIIASSSSVGWP